MAGNAHAAQQMQAAADLMRRRGLKVGAFAGWATAGRSSDVSFRAVTAHHTAAAIDVDRILRDGRSDLPGPLCNWALHKDGSWWLVASGRANHAGVGTLPSSASYGIECTGPIPVSASGTQAFPMYDSYVLGVACILEVEGWSAKVVYGHKETAEPDCRKPDPAFGDGCPKPYLDMNTFRARVQAKIGEEDDFVDKATFLDWMTDWAKSSDGQEQLRRAAEAGSTQTIRKAVGKNDGSEPASPWFDGMRADMTIVKGQTAPAPAPPA